MCTFLKGDYERYKVKKEKQLADGGHMGRIIGIDLVHFLEEAVGKGGFHNNGMLQKEGGHHRNISQ